MSGGHISYNNQPIAPVDAVNLASVASTRDRFFADLEQQASEMASIVPRFQKSELIPLLRKTSEGAASYPKIVEDALVQIMENFETSKNGAFDDKGELEEFLSRHFTSLKSSLARPFYADTMKKIIAASRNENAEVDIKEFAHHLTNFLYKGIVPGDA